MHKLICMPMTLSYIVVVRIYNVFRMFSSLIFTEYRIGCKITQLNVSKSVIMLNDFWQKLQNSSVSVSVNSKPLASVTSTHCLGSLIDQHLNWKSHVDNVLKRVRCKLYTLYCLKTLPGHLLFWLYQAFVLLVFA